MKIYISCSKAFYDKVGPIKFQLEELGHHITPPNGWNDASSEELIQKLDMATYIEWKAKMIRKNNELVNACDSILILNLTKDGVESYIGGATFLEAYRAFESGKKIFLYNPIPSGLLRDELVGFNPTVIYGDLTRIQ